MNYEAKQIAKMLKGSIEGESNPTVWKLCKIEEGVEGGITFLANPKYTHYAYDTKASVILVKKDFVPEKEIPATMIRVDNPYLSMAQLLKVFNDANRPGKGKSRKCSIGRKSKLGKNCYVGEFAVIGRNVTIGNNVQIYPQVYIGDNVTIGDDTILYAGVKIYRECQVGSRCILHAGAVVGADGFGFAPQEDGTYSKIDQIGNVVIEDDVEVGANACIDRATMGSTIVQRGVKIDNLCQIAHNVVVGHDTAMASQTGIAGSTKVGSNCVFAGQVGIVGHIEVGDHVIVAAQSGVTRNVAPNSTMLGSPALDASRQRKVYVLTRNIETMEKRLAEVEKKLKNE
ncbi:MAG: UDP-3-O-(3-hydroxymyristoyl)glucosamine N-acyltransferase [Bacteroidales bacterium]|nr:UDP-3-O-(3-hydroxymyristoyl)glucosamine N-acyltransferase [Bacteroidales bacterium]